MARRTSAKEAALLRYLAHPYQLLGVVLAVVVGLIGHNLVQAWVADRLGDREPRRRGFLRPDLHRQADGIGAIATLVVPFGWGFAAPVPIEARFRRQRMRATIALLAGPAYLVGLLFGAVAIGLHTNDEHALEITGHAIATLAGLVVLSLIPIPPLAGGRVFFLYAPTSPGWQRARFTLGDTNAGRLVAFGILILPILFPLLPDVVHDLAEPLVRGVIRALGTSPNPL